MCGVKLSELLVAAVVCEVVEVWSVGWGRSASCLLGIELAAWAMAEVDDLVSADVTSVTSGDVAELVVRCF